MSARSEERRVGRLVSSSYDADTRLTSQSAAEWPMLPHLKHPEDIRNPRRHGQRLSDG